MNEFPTSARRARLRLLAVGVAAVLLLVACGGNGGNSESAPQEETAGPDTATGPAETAATDPAAEALAAAQAQTEEALEGVHTGPPTDSNPAAEDKNVWIVVSGLASTTAANSARNFEKAAELLGWNTEVFDAELNPAKFPAGIRQAITSGADGVVTIGIDCPFVKAALEEARAADIVAVGLYSLDCDEITPGAESLYEQIGFGDRFENVADAYRGWGSDAAAWIIAATEGAPNVIHIANEEYNILRFYQEGFEQRMSECETCVVTTVEFLATEFGPDLTSKVKAAFLQNPEANAVQANVNPELGVQQGVLAAGKADEEVAVIGGFGLAANFDAVRENQGLDAVAAQADEWWSFAAADTMNSVFNGTPIRDSGVGWRIFDEEHGLPPQGEDYIAEVDYVDAYKTSWGVE